MPLLVALVLAPAVFLVLDVAARVAVFALLHVGGLALAIRQVLQLVQREADHVLVDFIALAATHLEVPL